MLGAAVVLVLAGCGSSDDDGGAASTTAPADSTTTTTSAGPESTTTEAPEGSAIEIVVMGGQVQGGRVDAKVAIGEEVTISITVDEAEELHVHGYDLRLDLTPGVAGELTFTADIPGVFEAELEHSGLQVLQLQVS